MQPVPHALSTNTGENTAPSPPDPAHSGRRLMGRAVSAAGAFLVVVALAFALIFLGAALFQDGPLAGAMAFLICLVPVAVGIGIAQAGTPGYWRRPLDLRDFWRWPGVAGVAIAFVSIPLVILWPDYGLLIATLALCLYPLLDVPRILARPSWWRAAAVSAFVWVVVFVSMMGVVEAVRHPREDAMIFLLPFTMYPLVLAISGVVRLAGRASGRTFESAPRIAAIAGAVACFALVAVPVGLSVIPVLVGKITGNSPRNSVTSEDGDVVSASPGEFSARLASGTTKSLRLGPETRFDFRGPGSALVEGPAVRIELNDCYAGYEGRIEGDAIKGEFSNEVGAREEWTARLQGSVSGGR